MMHGHKSMKLLVLMLMKGSKIQRIELNTAYLYQHYSLFMPNKLQYTCRGYYCKCGQPDQFPVLTEVRAPSLLEQHPRYVPHRDRAGYNKETCLIYRSSSQKTVPIISNALKTLKFGVISSCLTIYDARFLDKIWNRG